MYIKSVRKTNGKTKKEYHTLHLVESYQTEKGPRQRLILNLGPLDIDREHYKELAAAIEKRLRSTSTDKPLQLSFMDCEDIHYEAPSVKKYADDAYRRIIEEKQAKKVDDPTTPSEQTELKPSNSVQYTPVDLATVQATPALSIGAEHVCHSIWKDLGLEEAIIAQGITIDTARLIETLVIGRLMQCGSERRIWQWADSESTLFELMLKGSKVLLPKGSFRGLYRACNVAYSIKDELESHLSKRERDLFDLPEKLCLFDLTNTFFEGSAHKNKKAAYGRSKEKRTDCPLLSLALLIDENGFAKYSKTFPGNVSEPSTLDDIIRNLRMSRSDLFAKNRPRLTVIMDKGIATKENLQYLRDNGLDYIVAKKGRCEIDEDRPSTIVREDKNRGSKVVVQPSLETLDDESGDVLLNCSSVNRQGKESSMRTKSEQKLIAALEAAKDGLKKKRCTKNYLKVLEKIGRLKERYSRVAKLYTIKVIPCGDINEDTLTEDITWAKKDGYDEMLTKEGSYILRSNRNDLTAAEYWEIYMTLNNVERSFRYLKSDLGLRPCHHQNEESSDAHIFITVLAYHVLHAIEHTLRKNGDTRTWATIKNVLSTHRRITIACATPEGSVHTRLCTTPTAEQLEIYRNLNISDTPLPKTITKLNFKK